jgi:hypothetical protein
MRDSKDNLTTRKILWCVGVLLLWLPASARDIKGVAVTVEPFDRFNRTFHGYVEYRVRLKNHSVSDEKQIELRYPEESYQNGNCISSLNKAVVLRPDTEVVVSLFQPPLAIPGQGQLAVTVDGEDDLVDMPIQSHGLSDMRWRRSTGPYPCLLLSRGLSSEMIQAVETEYKSLGGTSRSGGRSSSSVTYEVKRSEIDVAQWSGQWLGYSRYDGVFLSGQEFQMAPSHVRDALTRMVECGGILVVVGPWQMPSAWQRFSEIQAGVPAYHVGFGLCYHVSESDPTLWNKALWRHMRSKWQSHAQFRSAMSTPEDANRAFPVVDSLAVPARGIFLLMLVFAILIGPVNVFFFSKRGKRMRLFWTVPLVSLLTSGVVFAYSILSEGITNRIRLAGVTILDQANHHAITEGWLGYYCPLTPGGGLVFDTQTELLPQVGMNNWRDSGRARSVVWSDRQTLDDGWIVSRIPSHFTVRRNETRRERLVLRHDTDGRLYATNSLGARVKRLWLADTRGKVYRSEEIATGQSRELTKNTAWTQTRAAPGACQEEARRWYGHIEQIDRHVRELLRPGTYVAQLDSNPFMEQGLKTGEVMQADCIVIGIMEEN